MRFFFHDFCKRFVDKCYNEFVHYPTDEQVIAKHLLILIITLYENENNSETHKLDKRHL